MASNVTVSQGARVDLTVHDRGGAFELVFSRFPAARDQVAAWYASGILIDAGGEHTARALEGWIQGRPLQALLLGHSHEDHSGGARVVVARGVPVFGSRGTAARLRRPARVPDYRARLWGQPTRVRVREPVGLPLEPVPLPGHSRDQLGYLDPTTGWLFSGDLLLRRRQQIAMPGEDPWAMIGSLRRALQIAPSALATSHRGLIQGPEPALRAQLDYLEELAGSIGHLRASGMSIGAISKELFGGEPRVPGSETSWRELSGGEFSSGRWIRAFLRSPRSRTGSRGTGS